MAVRDYFAELYVAGLMADNGWSIYFPMRDVGFDFIATKLVLEAVLIRPVQVKGLYPGEAKKNRSGYGYVGRLTQLHPDMALVLPYFSTNRYSASPDCIAFMPRSEIKNQASHGFACCPANFTSSKAMPRKSFRKYFGLEGLQSMASHAWGKSS